MLRGFLLLYSYEKGYLARGHEMTAVLLSLILVCEHCYLSQIMEKNSLLESQRRAEASRTHSVEIQKMLVMYCRRKK